MFVIYHRTANMFGVYPIRILPIAYDWQNLSASVWLIPNTFDHNGNSLL